MTDGGGQPTPVAPQRARGGRLGAELSTRELAGQLVVGGFAGTALPAEVDEALGDGRLGGVILFKRNVPDIDTASALCRSTLLACPEDLPPFIGVDEEGGRVRRMPPPALALPPMRHLGLRGSAELVRRAARGLAVELRATGFNLDFAPVLDVDSNPKNPVIGDRSFGAEPEIVVTMARAVALGFRDEGLLSCGKHFPGHGDTEKDSHVDLPIVTHGRERLDEVEMVPFRALCSDVDAMMSAHVLYPALDRNAPATLSSAIATGLLRDELGFEGVLFSDDLEMGALANRMPVEESAVRAVRAGCDVLLICRQPPWQERARQALATEIDGDPAFRTRCEEAVDRSLRARRRCPPRPAHRDQLDSLVGGAASFSLARELG